MNAYTPVPREGVSARMSLSELRRILPADEAWDVHMGRSDWTHADYLAAAHSEFDALEQPGAFAAFNPHAPANRDRWVRAWVQMNMPRSKRAAHAREKFGDLYDNAQADGLIARPASAWGML